MNKWSRDTNHWDLVKKAATSGLGGSEKAPGMGQEEGGRGCEGGCRGRNRSLLVEGERQEVY